MLLTITSTAPNATDLGFLLHKHPDRVQQTRLSVGTATVWYPEASADRCTVALLLDVDPIGLVRERRFGGDETSLAEYVNDLPYASTSLLAVALNRVFRTAMSGVCTARPELVDEPLPLEINLTSVRVGERPDLPEVCFGPLGWEVETRTHPLDATIPAWGDAPHVDVTLRGTLRLADALTQIYVLLPAIAASKHYWVTSDEVDKLLRAGGQWLAGHPARELITTRYLVRQRALVRSAVDRLAALDDQDGDAAVGPDVDLDTDRVQEEAPEEPAAPSPDVQPPRLNVLRKSAVLAELARCGARRVVDLGCGAGALLRDLIADPTFTQIVGVDVSARALVLAERRLHFERMPDSKRARISLLQSSITYEDRRLAGFDAIVLMEVVEHLDLPRLPALEASVFGAAQPAHVIVTTPNADYNIRYEGLAPGGFRHRDHRFEWTRAEFQEWASAICDVHGYVVRFEPVGEVDHEVGSPTQLGVFTRLDGAGRAVA